MQVKNHKIEFFLTTDDLLKLMGEKEGYEVRTLLDIANKFKPSDKSHYDTVVKNTPGGLLVQIEFVPEKEIPEEKQNTIKAK